MKISQRFKSVKILLLAVLAVGFGASQATGQEVAGKFTLPFEARWGKAVLPPGEYTFPLELGGRPYLARIRHNSEGVAFVPADSMQSHEALPGRSALVAVRSRGKYRIRTLRLADPGVVLTYAFPPAERQFIAQAPELLQRIPVSVQGK